MSDTNQKKMLQNVAENFPEENCINDALLLQFIEGHTGAEETTKIQAHLNECEICAHIVGSVYYNKTHPFTEAEQREAEELLTRSPEEEVALLLDLPPRKERVFYPRPQPRWFERFFAQPLVGRLAFAACTVMLMLGGRGVWRYAQTTSKLEQAAALLQKEYTVYIKDARLSGGYGSSGISELMGPEEEEEKYSTRAAKLATQAIQNGAESVQAKQLLAQSFFIEKKYERVDSLMRDLAPLAANSATLLNDLGVYNFKKQNWAEAEKYFSAAIARDAKFLEARYNLALTKAEAGAREKAVKIMQEYLALETDENWRNAAEDFIKKE